MNSENVLQFPPNKQKDVTTIQKLMRFFESTTGRKTSQLLIAGMACTFFVTIYGRETYLVGFYIEKFLKMKSDNIPQQVDDAMKNLIEKAATEAKVKLPMCRSFITNGTDISHIGSTKTLYYGWIGIPLNYFFNSIENVEKSIITNNTIDWNSENGKMLKNSLVLTNDEKLFAIRRAIYEMNNHKFIWDTMYATFSVIGAYGAGQYCNLKFNLFKKSRYIRYGSYPVFVLVAFAVHGIVKDFSQQIRLKRVDKKLIDYGEDNIKDGISFYTKNINKNIALRKLNNDTKYTQDGNEVQFFGCRNLDLTERKKFLVQSLNALKK